MELTELAKYLTTLLSPLIPYLKEGGKKLGEKAVEELGKKIGNGVFDGMKGVWERLRQKKEVEQAADDVMEKGESAETVLQFRVLEELVKDPELAGLAEQMLDAIPADKLDQLKPLTARALSVVEIQHSSIAYGENSRAVSAHKYVEKNETHHHHYREPVPAGDNAEDAKESYRHKYLRGIVKRGNNLPLGALGGEEHEADEVTLEQVYIELDTTENKHPDKSKDPTQEVLFREDESLSALEAATQNRRLVLLGDPGAGKTSFVNQLAVCLAQTGFSGEKPPLGWPQATVPVMTTLRNLMPRLSGLEPDELQQEQRDDVFVNAIFDYWREDFCTRSMGAEGFIDELPEILERGDALLVFDGLDEVAVALRPRVRDAISALARCYPDIKHIIITCRIRSYSGNALLPGFADKTIAPFDAKKINRFIGRWYEAQLSKGRVEEEDCKYKIDDLKEAAGSSSLQELAENPMLLTTMAIIHQRDTGLPNERVKLYSLAVDVLLHRWQKKRIKAFSEALNTLLGDEDKLREVVERIAYEAHSRSTEKTHDFERGELLTLLEGKSMLDSHTLANEFLDYIDHRAGLLVGMGGTEESKYPPVYTFPHRTFQEYLAGSYLVRGRGHETARYYREKIAEGDYWYLAGQLGAEELLYQRKMPHVLLDLMYDLCPDRPPNSEQDWRAVVWSGQMAALVGREKIIADKEGEAEEVYLDRQIARLCGAITQSALTAVERSEAGNALAVLGDPRQEVMNPEEVEFLLIPTGVGVFWMGSDKYDDEKPRHPCEMGYDYHISRFPVTNAQFEVFIAAHGYENEAYWAEAKSAGVWSEGAINDKWSRDDESTRNRPISYREPFMHANHPVVGINWYEALAFCRWLDERLQVLGKMPDNCKALLPSEAEWEKAARGEGGQEYPWDGVLDAGKSNGYRANIGATSAVGCFRKGKSPYGVEEMSGNVWEWTRSVFAKYPYDFDKSKEREVGIKSDSTSCVLRGGAFDGNPGGLRAAYRGRNLPNARDGNIGFRVVLSPFSISDL